MLLSVNNAQKLFESCFSKALIWCKSVSRAIYFISLNQTLLYLLFATCSYNYIFGMKLYRINFWHQFHSLFSFFHNIIGELFNSSYEWFISIYHYGFRSMTWVEYPLSKFCVNIIEHSIPGKWKESSNNLKRSYILASLL